MCTSVTVCEVGCRVTVFQGSCSLCVCVRVCASVCHGACVCTCVVAGVRVLNVPRPCPTEPQQQAIPSLCPPASMLIGGQSPRGTGCLGPLSPRHGVKDPCETTVLTAARKWCLQYHDSNTDYFLFVSVFISKFVLGTGQHPYTSMLEGIKLPVDEPVNVAFPFPSVSL